MYLKSQIDKIEKILDTSFNASVSSLVEYLFLKNKLEELREDYEMLKKRGKRWKIVIVILAKKNLILLVLQDTGLCTEISKRIAI